MRFLDCLVFGTAALAMACGGSQSDHFDPAPDPMITDYCAEQHQQGDIAVCDKLYAEAPFVHVPAATPTRVIAGVQNTTFVTADGTTYPYPGNQVTADPEQARHAIALYELELSNGTVTSFHPVVTFDESLFVAPFMGHAFEGTISRRVTGATGGQYALDASLPVRLEILNQTANPTSKNAGYQAQAQFANLDSAVTAADGSCMPALSSYGSEAPFDAGATVTVAAGRAPWMHGFGDDEFTFEIFVNGTSIGSLMAPTWYRGPIDLVRGTLAPAGEYDGVGHGTPGYIPALKLDPVDGGGAACTAP